METADAIVVGAGLAGLVAAAEIADAGKRVIVVDQEGAQSLGAQAFWSFGGLFFVDSPEQRRLGVRDSHALALDDWLRTAGFDRDDDVWPRRWAEAYVDFATHEKRAWLRAQGMRWFPIVGWAERGHGDVAHGNSVPRFHVTWGTGPGVLAPFLRRTHEAQQRGTLTFRFRHRVDDLTFEGGAVTGVRDAPSHAQNTRRFRDRSRGARIRVQRHDHRWTVCRGGSRGLWRRYARLSVARGNVSRRLSLFGPPSRTQHRRVCLAARNLTAEC